MMPLDRNIERYTASISNGRSRTDEAKYQKLRQSLLGYELIVDSAEQPVQRPVDYQGRKKYYSGKKKCIHLKINLLFYLARISL